MPTDTTPAGTGTGGARLSARLVPVIDLLKLAHELLDLIVDSNRYGKMRMYPRIRHKVVAHIPSRTGPQKGRLRIGGVRLWSRGGDASIIR